jgi:hypothetical protein
MQVKPCPGEKKPGVNPGNSLEYNRGSCQG